MRPTSPRLTSTSFALLGAVAQAGPCSPYELKRVLARTLGPVWEVPHSQLYEEAGRLARAGLLVETQEGSGRRRLSYTITEDGRRELLRWLRLPSRERIEIRDVGLLKLSFADLLDPSEVVHLAQDHADAWRQVLADTGTGEGRAAAYTRAVAEASIAYWQILERSMHGMDGAAPDRELLRTPDDAASPAGVVLA